jgi:hypothetical protein
MNTPLRRYAVGRWESLWASEPHISHRILLDLPARKVIAGQDRFRKQRRPMSIRDVEYMQQMLEETYNDIFDEPQEYDFEVIENPPHWALEA